MYGIPDDERNSEIYKFFFGKNKVLQGTEFFGRVLMSMILAPNEKPTKGSTMLNSYREPPALDYLLRIDVYEIQEAFTCGERVKIKVSIGSNSDFSKYALKTFKVEHNERIDINGTYTWKEKKVQVNDIKVKYPADKSQIPDVFISLYTDAFMGEKRVAYLRLPVTDESLSNQEPKWYHMKSIDNQMDTTPCAYALLNIQFRIDSKSTAARIPKRRDIRSKYFFIAFVYAGYDLGADLYSDEIQPQLEIRIPPEKPFVPKKNKQIGKNPVWNEFLHREIEMDDNLEFAPNLTVAIINGLGNNKVGEFSIPSLECKLIRNFDDFTLEPKLYTIQKEGAVQGRIMASFTLIKNPKKMSKDFIKNNKIHKIKADLEFSVIGIRNLVPAFKNPVMKIKVAGISQVKELKLDKDKDPDVSEFINPNFLEVVKFSDLDLSYEPLYLSPLEVELCDEGAFFSEKFFCTISLVERAVWVKSQRVLEVLAMFGRVGSGESNSSNKKKKKETDFNAKNLKILEVASQSGKSVLIVNTH